MRPKSLANRIWETVRNDGTPNNKKYLGITPRDTYRGYKVVRGSDWSNQLKWLQNPEYYRIDKDNIEYLIRVTEC
ncbi:unnamed protein product [Rhizophagus irregularis]|nr:unnamed protein product [Rhizophagus irregularis]